MQQRTVRCHRRRGGHESRMQHDCSAATCCLSALRYRPRAGCETRSGVGPALRHITVSNTPEYGHLEDVHEQARSVAPSEDSNWVELLFLFLDTAARPRSNGSVTRGHQPHPSTGLRSLAHWDEMRKVTEKALRTNGPLAVAGALARLQQRMVWLVLSSLRMAGHVQSPRLHYPVKVKLARAHYQLAKGPPAFCSTSSPTRRRQQIATGGTTTGMLHRSYIQRAARSTPQFKERSATLQSKPPESARTWNPSLRTIRLSLLRGQ